jgi:hypothetical protein
MTPTTIELWVGGHVIRGIDRPQYVVQKGAELRVNPQHLVSPHRGGDDYAVALDITRFAHEVCV